MFFGVFEAYLIFRFSFELKVNNQKNFSLLLRPAKKGLFQMFLDFFNFQKLFSFNW